MTNHTDSAATAAHSPAALRGDRNLAQGSDIGQAARAEARRARFSPTLADAFLPGDYRTSTERLDEIQVVIRTNLANKAWRGDVDAAMFLLHSWR